jgi:hypothetical protein
VCLSVSVGEREGESLCEGESVCVCMYAVKLGIQSGCWISVVPGMRHWKLAASFPPTGDIEVKLCY